MLKIGVPFYFKAGKKGGVTYESLQGDDLRKVLKNFDLRSLFPESRAQLIKKLWSDFLEILQLIRDGTSDDAGKIRVMAKAWWDLFTTKPTGAPNSKTRQEGL